MATHIGYEGQAWFVVTRSKVQEPQMKRCAVKPQRRFSRHDVIGELIGDVYFEVK